MPLLLVCTGPKISPHRDLEFRISWSIYELFLAIDMPLWVRQAYVAFKYTVKKEMTERRGRVDKKDGRSIISSYHLKNVLLWTQRNLQHGRFLARFSFSSFLLRNSLDI